MAACAAPIQARVTNAAVAHPWSRAPRAILSRPTVIPVGWAGQATLKGITPPGSTGRVVKDLILDVLNVHPFFNGVRHRCPIVKLNF